MHDYLQKVYCWDNKSSSKLRDVALYMCGHMIKTALFTVKKDEGGLIVNLKYKHDWLSKNFLTSPSVRKVSVRCKWQIMTTHGSFPGELIIKKLTFDVHGNITITEMWNSKMALKSLLISIRFMVFKGLLLFTRLGIRRTDIVNLWKYIMLLYKNLSQYGATR